MTGIRYVLVERCFVARVMSQVCRRSGKVLCFLTILSFMASLKLHRTRPPCGYLEFCHLLGILDSNHQALSHEIMNAIALP
ncbi:hypothetical protein BU26DRAFT_332070 [Trematosphaeria pertusa]|uniref:Uncharacterized protein n=1 Tax=Trematosphaeria pertusa TaxID=390896 RepID=A0A6A6IE69_9PLEO|nr:uncharacterized protein BU26DRAFT_332070 [Trematosphaeria pertusa]KAF2248358.1 hypothetical protein BU26DRAFT_332070 [Trematosphaeria pertusa]